MSSRSTVPSASCTRGSKALAHRRNRAHLHFLQNLFHLLHDQAHARAQLLRRSRRFQRQLKVVQHRQKLLHHAAGHKVALLCLLALGALARVLKLRLKAGQPIEQLIALGLQLSIRFCRFGRQPAPRHRSVPAKLFIAAGAGNSVAGSILASSCPPPWRDL